MGSRCDFYVGRGPSAEWLGSYPWDGGPDGIPEPLKVASTEADYRAAVTAFLTDPENARCATLPERGWPWPWDSSSGTDYAYAFDEGKVWASCFGRVWFEATGPDAGCEGPKIAVFPDMSARKNTTLGPRSGLIVARVPRLGE